MTKQLLFDILQNAPENIQIPEWIISSIREAESDTNTYMVSVETPDGKHLYCVRDWVYSISRSKANNRSGPWSDLKKTFDGHNEFRVSEILRVLEVETPGGKQLMDFTDEEGLYQITQRMSDRSKVVREVKTWLAKSGVFMGDAYNNPIGTAAQFDVIADKREYRKLLAEDFTPEEAEEWLSVRQKQKRGRALTNQIHRVALGRTATRHKRELAVKDTPRNYISAADNATIQITEVTSVLLHEHRESFGKPELSEDIDDVRPIIDAARPEIQKVFSQKPRRLSAGNRPKTELDE